MCHSTTDEKHEKCNNIVYECNNIAYDCDTKQQLTKVYHATFLDPPHSTIIKAAKAGYLRWCPGLKEKLLCKFVKEGVETHQGHMKQ
eukprot:3279823-Ditylum_brightwellii.AAC.1